MKNKICAYMMLGALFCVMTACGKPADVAEETKSTETMSQEVEAESEMEEVVNFEDTQTAQEDVPQYDGYTLLFNDEFNGTELNLDIWDFEPHKPGWVNAELQEYTKSTDNVFIRNGKVVIKAIKTVDVNGNDYYTSGKITTKDRQEFMYGKVVVSAKVPEGQGLWPAIWMMPARESLYGSWPKCGEIDIMEFLGNQVDTVYGTIHYGEPHAEQQGKYVLEGQSFADDFHEFSVEWEPGEMRFFIDGNLYHTVNDWYSEYPGVAIREYPAPFNQDFYVQLNLAVGGTWPGNPDETTDFEKAEFEVDYVRVYQKPEYDMNVQKPEKVFREPLADGNLIYNGDFADAESLTDATNWEFMLFSTGDGSAEIADGVMNIKTVNAGDLDYSLQLVQSDLPIYRDKKYRLTFDACASEDRSMIVCVSGPTAGYIRYLPDTTVDMTTDWQTYSYEFEMKERDDNKARIEYNMGKAGSVADISIRNVRIEEIK